MTENNIHKTVNNMMCKHLKNISFSKEMISQRKYQLRKKERKKKKKSLFSLELNFSVYQYCLSTKAAYTQSQHIFRLKILQSQSHRYVFS